VQTILKYPSTSQYIIKDNDGLYSLNIVNSALSNVKFGPPGSDILEPRRQRIEEIRSICANQVELLCKTGNHRAQQKWHWFQSEFERLVAQLDPKMLGP